MNILPLILALVLMLSVLTVERLEKFKNQSIIQKEYQLFLKENERQVFNSRQKHLFKESDLSLRQLTFRYIYDKKARERYANEANQYRILMIALMKNLYEEAAFYRELKQKRDNFLDELLTEIEKAAELASKHSSKKFIREVEDLARLKLEDPELQEAFYHMLKGTTTRDKLEEAREEFKEKGGLPPRMKEKAYVSLFKYININGNPRSVPPTIKIARAPRETLMAIFDNEEVVELLMARREELGGKDRDSGADELLKSEFVGKRRPGIDEKLLDFKLSAASAIYR